MTHPRFTVRDFIKSVHPETPQMFYVISEPSKFGTHLGPGMDFEVDFPDGKVVLFTATRHFDDRGVQCAEYRPADWLPQAVMNNLRIRFYTPGQQAKRAPIALSLVAAGHNGTCEDCGCGKRTVGEDVGE